MKYLTKVICVFLAIGMLSSCVSKKKFLDLESSNSSLQNKLKETQMACEQEITELKKQLQDNQLKITELEGQISKADANESAKDDKIKSLEQQLTDLKSTNNNLLDRLSDLSIVSKAGAESIKKSLEALDDQNKYVRDLNQSIQKKDSVNLALVMNLKRSLADINDQDIQVEVKKGVVYVSISDKLLFSSGSHRLTSRAQTVLGKVASVLNDHSNLDVLVEGHTDNVPIRSDCVEDNWDLSVKRATSVVRNLQTTYNVDPARLTAGGRSEYVPKFDNQSNDGRKANRRTEIIITPRLDEFFNLLAPSSGN